VAVETPLPRPEGLVPQRKYTQGQGLGDVELRADIEPFLYGNPLARLGYELYKEGKINLVPRDPDGERDTAGTYESPSLAKERRNAPQGVLKYIQREELNKGRKVDPLKILVHELTHAGIDIIEAREKNRLRNLADEYAFEGRLNEPVSRPGFNPYGYIDFEEGVVRAGDALMQGRLGDAQNLKNEEVGKTGFDLYFKNARRLRDSAENRKLFKQDYLNISKAAQDILNQRGIPPEATSPSDTREESFGKSFKDFFRTLVGKDKERSKLNYLGFTQPIDDKGNVYDRDVYNRDGELSLGYIDPSDPSKLNKGAALMTMPLTEATSNPTGNKRTKPPKIPRAAATKVVDPRDEALKLVAKKLKDDKTQVGIPQPVAPTPVVSAQQPMMTAGLAAPMMPQQEITTMKEGGTKSKKGKGLAVVIGMSGEQPEYEEASKGTPADPPPGATSDEVKDDQQVLLSEGELVVPANVVRYHGLGMYEGLRREALRGLGEMEDAGQVEYIDDGIKTAQAGMTILDAPNVATSQGIARQQQQYNPALGQFGTATVPQAASSRFVRAPGFTDTNRDGIDDKLQPSVRGLVSPTTTTGAISPASLTLGPVTDPNVVVGAGNVGSYQQDQTYKPGDDEGTPVDNTIPPVAPSRVVQQGGDGGGGDPEIAAGLGGARTTIGGVDYAVQYDFSGNIIGLANVADALATGKANFTVPNPDVVGLIEQQTAGQKAIGTAAFAPVANAFGFLENNKATIDAGKAATAALDSYRGQVGMRPQDMPMGRPSQAVIDAYAQEKINPNALAAPEMKALSMPANYEEAVGNRGTSDAARLAELQGIQNTISASPEDKSIYSDSLGGSLSKEEAEFLSGMTDTITASDRPRATSGIEDVPTQSQMDRDTAFREAAEAKSRKEAREAQMVGMGMGFAASTVAPGTPTNDAIQGKGYSSTGAAPKGSQYSSTGTFSTDSSDDDTGVGSSGDLGGATGAGYGAGSEGTDSSDDESTGSTGSNVSQTGGTSGVSYADDAQSSGSGGGGGGCVIATHGVSTGGFTVMEKAKAELWCQKTYHGKWYGEAFRRGYKAAGMKHINAGTAPSVYQEFKDFVAYGRGIKKGWKAGLNYYFRTISFFITGLFIK
jgi:hypothetical protein